VFDLVNINSLYTIRLQFDGRFIRSYSDVYTTVLQWLLAY